VSLEQALKTSIAGEVRFDRISRALYATDASVYQIEPQGVVIPRTRDDVVRVVQVAAEYGTTITARGGGTSQAGQAIGAGLILDTSKYLNRVLEINADEQWARVEPGVVLDDLNARLKRVGLRFAPDLSSSSRATVGGMMANNSSGARSIVYGKTIDHVLEQHAVLADGRVSHLRPLSAAELDAARRGDGIEARACHALPALAAAHADEIARRFPRVLRRVGGYNLDAFVDRARPVDLSRIMIGSEGTLGIVTEARIRLVPLPAARAVLAVEFEHTLDALAAAPVVLTHGPSAIEVMDGFILGYTRQSATLDAIRRTIFSDAGGALLCIEFAGDAAGPLAGKLDTLTRDLTARFRCRATPAVDPLQQQRIWSLREAALGLSTAMTGDAKSISFVEDTAVPPERLRDYIERFLGIIRRHGTTAGIYAHASVGCLHVRPVINLKTEDGVERFQAIASDVADLVLEFGGALSGEHGDGIVRGPFTEKMFGPVLYDAFKTIKRTFDPSGLFNPGKIIESPPLTSNLRYGPRYSTAEPTTFFDYAAHGGLGRAVEMCSGVGACRKTLDGTMCPSYRVTLEEKHSTRGRANVLRLAMTGQLDETGLGDGGVYDALDLCLECRACKTECPTGVDVARFKSEFLADYWRRHGTPMRARAFGHIHTAAKWASGFAPLSNVLMHSAAGRWVTERWLGIDRRRAMPEWTRATLTRRVPRSPVSDPAAVLLFVDTFTEYSEPQIGVAAIDVLRAAGQPVRLAPNVCCGRPLISQGLLPDARRLSVTNVARLYDAAARGATILFLEPSCLSAIREDVPALLRGELQQQARVVAEASMSFEAYLEREQDAGRLHVPLRAGPSSVLLHAHCHQRAMGLAPAARALLGRIPATTVTDLDAGCCGMAGSFGYAKDHYDVSRAIGELKLFPAARTLAAGAGHANQPVPSVLVAAGTSCRHQVAHFTGVQAVHPAVLLRSLLTGPGDRGGEVTNPR
jgi:FAD/FMN-containing dehydrogenase/Fe-S oxidoreductase